MADIEDDDDLSVKKGKKGNKGKKVKEKTGSILKKLIKNPVIKSLFIKIILIILLIIFLLGIVLFVINMPGNVKDSIEEWGRNVLANAQKFLFGDDSVKITEKQVIELAQHLEDMGYNTLGYGLGNPIYEKDSNGKDTTFHDGIRGKTVVKIGESVDGKSYLRSYIAANEHTYTLADYSLKGFLETTINNIGAGFGLSDFQNGDENKAKSTGLIQVVGSNADSILKFLAIDRETKQLRVYSSSTSFTSFLDEHGLSFLGWLSPIPTEFLDSAKGLFTGSEYTQYGNSYSYDLDNWLARYGRPTELFLALHLSTLMPDLTYRIASEEEFNTKVELAMMPLNATYEVSATKGDVTIEGKQISDLYEQQLGGLSYLKDTMDNTDEVIKRLKANGDADKLIPNTNWTYGEIAELQAVANKSPETRNIGNQSITTTNNSALTEAPKPFDSVTEDNGHFTKYTYLTDDQVRDIAKVCCREQGNENLNAIAGEASLMANIFEKSRGSNYYTQKGVKHDTNSIHEFVRYDTWFGGDKHRSEKTMDFPDGDPHNPVTDDAVEIVKQVLVKGKRTLPIYILEHDSTGDLECVITDGQELDPHDHNNYKKDETIVVQSKAAFGEDAGKWTFYCFLSDTSDPFGYNEKTDEEFHYMIDENTASLSQSNSTGSFDMLWPFITGVKKHWFYEDIDFTKNVYRFAKDATKIVVYKPEDEENALNKDNVDVKLNTNLTSSMGIIYQVAEPSAMGPNENILKIFDDEYYKYDGQDERAKLIANAKAGDEHKDRYSFNGEDDIPYDKSLAKEVKKEKVSFENNKINSLTAFGILENTHTEASDYIYRNLKELLLYRKYFTRAELTTEIEEIMLWPIKTDNQFSKWETKLSKINFGKVIKCKNDEKTVIAPSDAIIKEINGDKILLQLTTLNEQDAELLQYVWNLKDPYTKINRDILTGMKLIIKDVKLKNTLKVGDNIKRGDILGEACGNLDGSNSITITMFDLDDSAVEDMNKYLREEENTKYEELIKTKRENTKTLGEKTGYDISPFLAGMQNVRQTSGTGVGIMTSTWMSKNEFVNRTKAVGNRDFTKYAEVVYDVCVKNNVNPVFCAMQAWIEQSWNEPDSAQFNFWGLGIFNGMQTSIYHFDTMEAAVQKWCDNINKRIKAEENGDPIHNMAESAKFSQFNNHYTGGINTIYDVYSNYAAPDEPYTVEDEANYSVEYVDTLLDECKKLYGDDVF